MNDKKRMFSFLILGLILFSFMLSFAVAAAADDIKGGIKSAGEIGSAILSPFFGEKEMLTRVFFAILIFMIIKTVTDTMWKNSGTFVKTVIPIIITLISLIGLPSDFLKAITVPYGAMGAAILVAIPFIIVLIFSIRTPNLFFGRMVWLFFIVYYFALYWHGLATVIASDKSWLGPEGIPYLAGIVGGLIVFFFMGAIRRFVFKGELEGFKESGTNIISEKELLIGLNRQELEVISGKKRTKK